MSERGSFTTEYIYCDKCFEAVKKTLLANEKGLCSIVIPSWERWDKKKFLFWNITKKRFLPIIAGNVGGGFAGEELMQFELYLIPEIEKNICHPVRIAVLPDCGCINSEENGKIFLIKPIDSNV